MTDIFEAWKINKFVITEYTDSYVVILTDIDFWNKNYEQLKDWCDEHAAEIKGMTVSLYNERQATLFALRWS